MIDPLELSGLLDCEVLSERSREEYAKRFALAAAGSTGLAELDETIDESLLPDDCQFQHPLACLLGDQNAGSESV